MVANRKKLPPAIIDVPLVRPPGVTPKQWRLAALLPRAENAYQALIQAGYKPSTALATARRTQGSAGVQLAARTIQANQADSARGLVGRGMAALESGAKDLDELRPIERLQFGLKAIEVGHSIGENVEATGTADAWRTRLRRAIRLAYHFGRVAGSRPQHLVLSPVENVPVTAKERNE